jgi:hypothetical protein
MAILLVGNKAALTLGSPETFRASELPIRDPKYAILDI